MLMYGCPLRIVILLPEEGDLALARVEVEELRRCTLMRVHSYAKKTVISAIASATREPVAEQEAEIGFDPALRDHDCASVGASSSSSRSSFAPSMRKTSPSAPTARPLPLGA